MPFLINLDQAWVTVTSAVTSGSRQLSDKDKAGIRSLNGTYATLGRFLRSTGMILTSNDISRINFDLIQDTSSVTLTFPNAQFIHSY